jgi:hypothetical protein
MDSDKMSVTQLFAPERQFLVPLFHRTYCWNQKDEWERRWSDIQEKAQDRLSEETPPTAHFMGCDRP